MLDHLSFCGDKLEASKIISFSACASCRGDDARDHETKSIEFGHLSLAFVYVGTAMSGVWVTGNRVHKSWKVSKQTGHL